MDLLEYEGKQIFRRYGIRVPDSQIARNPMEASTAATRLGQRCMVKAQVRQGGRGKAGLVKSVDDSQTAARVAAELFSTSTAVEAELLLIEQRLEIERELYLAIRIDDVTGHAVVMASTRGGIEVENNSAAIAQLQVDILDGLATHETVALWKRAGLSGKPLLAVAMLTLKLWKAFCECDAQLIEINPLVIDKSGQVWAVDAKVTLDDNAMYRQPEYQKLMAAMPATPLEARARRLGVNTYVDLADEGIVTISSGASLGMLVLDKISAAGGKAANFIDMGGGSTPIARQKIIDVVLYKAEHNPGIRAILVAFLLTSKPLQITIDAIRNAFADRAPACPAFAWICASGVATQELSIDGARSQLEATGIKTFATLEEAIGAATEASKQ